MIRLLVAIVCVWAGITLVQAPVAEPQRQVEQPAEFHLAEPGQPIAGIPQEEALKIYGRHEEELRKLPGAVSVSFTAEGLVVETINPTALPPAVEGLPVIPVLPVDPRSAATINDDWATRPRPVPEPVPLPDHLEVVDLTSEPSVSPDLPQDCGAEAHWDATAGRCRRNAPLAAPSPELLPPPKGVIVLRADGVREQRESCPAGFEEVRGLNNWRFCLDPKKRLPIPPMMAPPIAGIPYEKALEILERHREELMRLPGVEAVGMGATGVVVQTENPAVLPTEIEGLPIEVIPPMGPAHSLNHTSNTRIRPLHGAVAISDNITTPLPMRGTLTGVALSQGKPWLIFPAHVMHDCEFSSYCPPSGGSLLNACSHYVGTERLQQPPITSTLAENVGFVQRWDPLVPGINSTDVAAAFMDQDTVDGNGSLSGNRTLEGWGGAFTGQEESPVPNTTVRVITSLDPHVLQATVRFTNQTVNVQHNCTPNAPTTPLIGQTVLEITQGLCFTGGDSGSIVLNQSGSIVGMFNWASVQAPCTGGGTNATTVRTTLGFDAWYGPQVKDQTIGTFRPSNAGWVIDNGNGKWDGTCAAAPNAAQDGCFVFGTPGSVNGVPRSLPVTGDWDGINLNNLNNTITVGVYRTDTNPNQFLLRNSNDAGQVDKTMPACLPVSGCQPVAGKWAGINGVTKVGVLALDGAWYLDNGDFAVTGCPPDTCFNTSAWTQPGDKPLAGDWNGDGIVTVGVFRPSTGTFYLSNQMPPTGVDVTIPAGSYLPVVGDWTGANIAGQISTKLGVFSPGTSGWYLATNLFPSNCSTDICFPAGSFGIPEDLPVSFGPSVIRAN